MRAIPPRPKADPVVKDRSLIATGAIGAILAAIYCATPLLAVVLGGIGLTAWLAKVDYVVMAVLLLGLALVGLGLYHRHESSGLAHVSANYTVPSVVVVRLFPELPRNARPARRRQLRLVCERRPSWQNLG